MVYTSIFQIPWLLCLYRANDVCPCCGPLFQSTNLSPTWAPRLCCWEASWKCSLTHKWAKMNWCNSYQRLFKLTWHWNRAHIPEIKLWDRQFSAGRWRHLHLKQLFRSTPPDEGQVLLSPSNQPLRLLPVFYTDSIDRHEAIKQQGIFMLWRPIIRSNHLLF